jgi:hypothetical protein
VRELFGDTISDLRVMLRTYTFRYRSPEHFLDAFRSFYGPMLKAYEALDATRQEALTADLHALLTASSVDETRAIIPSAYVEIVATRR